MADVRYVKVRRQKTTIYLQCVGSETILDLKKKVSAINGVELASQRLQIHARVLKEDQTIDNLQIGDGDELHLVFLKEQADETLPPEYEEVNVVDYVSPPEQDTPAAENTEAPAGEDDKT